MMKHRHLYQRFAAVCLLIFSAAAVLSAQKAPRQETLLNGLKVYIWNDTAADKVSVKLRVHAGSSFDPQNKEGVMKMLSEAIFPSDEARQFFTDDLDGSFSVECNYDYIQLDLSSRKDAYLDLLETLSNAVSRPLLDKETTDAVRTRVSAQLDERLGDTAYHADRIAAERLFGTFPYGRPIHGTKESLAKIDFADILFGYQRFFGADNAVLTISGDVDGTIAYRAARRFFGSWLKSDKRVPSTFKQPDTPDSSLEVLKISSDKGAELRHSLRGFSRADADFPASEILTEILNSLLQRRVSIDPNAVAVVRNEAHILPGQLVFAVSRIDANKSTELYPKKESVDALALVPDILDDVITQADLQAAKDTVLSRLRSELADKIWLDSETYRLSPVGSQIKKYELVTLNDVQKLAASLKTRPTVNLWMVKGVGAE